MFLKKERAWHSPSIFPLSPQYTDTHRGTHAREARQSDFYETSKEGRKERKGQLLDSFLALTRSSLQRSPGQPGWQLGSFLLLSFAFAYFYFIYLFCSCLWNTVTFCRSVYWLKSTIGWSSLLMLAMCFFGVFVIHAFDFQHSPSTSQFKGLVPFFCWACCDLAGTHLLPCLRWPWFTWGPMDAQGIGELGVQVLLISWLWWLSSTFLLMERQLFFFF